MHKCIKKQLGTSNYSKSLYSMIKKQSFIARVKKQVLGFLLQNKLGIVAFNIFRVMLKIIFYYADIYKDIFFLTQVSIVITEVLTLIPKSCIFEDTCLALIRWFFSLYCNWKILFWGCILKNLYENFQAKNFFKIALMWYVFEVNKLQGNFRDV